MKKLLMLFLALSLPFSLTACSNSSITSEPAHASGAESGQPVAPEENEQAESASQNRVLVTSIVSMFGTTQIAANGLANSVDQIAVMVVSAVNLAMITVVGQCIGAREHEQAKGSTYKLMKVSYLSTALLGGIVCMGLPLILSFYDLPAETLRLSAVLIIMHNILAFALHPTSFNLANSLRASGDVKFTMCVGISSMLLFRLGSAVLFGIVFHLGVLGVWIAMGMDWLARSVAFAVRYRSGHWKTIRIVS